MELHEREDVACLDKSRVCDEDDIRESVFFGESGEQSLNVIRRWARNGGNLKQFTLQFIDVHLFMMTVVKKFILHIRI